MSAGNWVVCPKCLRKIEDQNEKLRNKIADQYGKLSLLRWKELESDTLKEIHDSYDDISTFRENFQISVKKDACFTIIYHGHCKKCDLEFTYDYFEEVDLD